MENGRVALLKQVKSGPVIQRTYLLPSMDAIIVTVKKLDRKCHPVTCKTKHPIPGKIQRKRGRPSTKEDVKTDSGEKQASTSKMEVDMPRPIQKKKKKTSMEAKKDLGH